MDQLDRRLESGAITCLDYYFCRFISEVEENPVNDEMQRVITDLSRALAERQSCLDLAELPNADELIALLQEMSCVGDGTTTTPLVLEGGKLYLHRYFSYEQRVAADLVQRNQPLAIDVGQFEHAIKSSFSGTGRDNGWQKVAVLQALTRQLTIITGGPGTGKTSTVIKILAIVLADQEIAVELAAPTGKAAMRLNETINAARPDLPEPVRSRMPDQVQTIHRLLGMRRDGRAARYNEQRCLPVDFLILDEVSMIDLPLMDRLLRALPEHTRLLLLGDPDQLPSVETGNILADVCRYPPGFSESVRRSAREISGMDLPACGSGHLLADAICHLQTNYRFSSDKGIGLVARSIREGSDSLPAGDDEVTIYDVGDLAEHPGETLARAYSDYIQVIRQSSPTPASLIGAFDRSRILAPVREGALGVIRLNETIEAHLRASGLIDGDHHFYHGRPIIIMRNDYTLGLFNGDTGITILDPADNQLKVAFKGIDGDIKLYLASRLPPHETCFAMTIHKSQGSEFDRVTLVLPEDLPDTRERVLTRELLYTAVTRARDGITLYVNQAAWRRGVTTAIKRNSGLAERFLSDAIDHAP